MTKVRQRNPLLRGAILVLGALSIAWAVLVAVTIVVHAVLPWVIVLAAVICIGWGLKLAFFRRR